MGIHHGNFGELAEAVYTGDLARAEAALDQMQRASCGDGIGDDIRRAKRRARPEEWPKIKAPKLVLPIPGHSPGATMGDEVADEAEAA